MERPFMAEGMHSRRPEHCRKRGHGPRMLPRERILLILAEAPEDGIHQKDIAEKIRINPSSLSEAIDKLESDGFEVVRIAPRADGIIYADDVAAAVDSGTILVSVMLVNNETGAIMPIDKIFSAVRAKNPDVVCHTDAVQAFGKIKINAKRLGADLISVSAHKVHAPKGCGALYVKKGVRIVPLHYGGEQEKKLRPGTEALPLIAAFGVACNEFDIDGIRLDVAYCLDYGFLNRLKSGH